MGFEDMFENRTRYRKYNQHHDKRYDDYQYHGYGNGHPALNIIGKIWNNPKLRLLFILAAVIVLVLVILVLIAIIPFVLKIIDSIAQTGLKGATESVTDFLEKLWNGSGN